MRKLANFVLGTRGTAVARMLFNLAEPEGEVRTLGTIAIATAATINRMIGRVVVHGEVSR